MNLIKNVDGPWDQSKQRMRQDLDTIQRTINQLQAALTALTTQVNTPPVIPPPTITPAGKATSPLPKLIEPDRLQQFLSTVATNGGLLGDGTVSNPLQVSVDGTTIAINSSGQIATVGSSPISLVTFSQSGGAFNFSSSPVTLVSAIANTTIIPVYWGIRVGKDTHGWTNGGTNFALTYAGGASAGITSLQTGLAGSGVVVTNVNWAVAAGFLGATTGTGNKNLRLSAAADVTATGGGVASLDLALFYSLIPG